MKPMLTLTTLVLALSINAQVVPATGEDHRALAQQYAAKAENYERKAAKHEAMAAAFAKNAQHGVAKTPMSPNSIEHCNYLAAQAHKAAEAARATEKMHAAQANAAH